MQPGSAVQTACNPFFMFDGQTIMKSDRSMVAGGVRQKQKCNMLWAYEKRRSIIMSQGTGADPIYRAGQLHASGHTTVVHTALF